MTRIVGGTDWRRRRGWGLLVAVVLVVAQVVRIAAGIHSWADFLVVPFGVGILAVILALVAYIERHGVARRGAVIRVGHPQAQVWLVRTRRTSAYLAVDPSAVMLFRGGRLAESWEAKQLRHAVVEQVPVGFPSRPGLRLEFGSHHTHESLVMVLPLFGGLWSSAYLARVAKQSVEAIQVNR